MDPQRASRLAGLVAAGCVTIRTVTTNDDSIEVGVTRPSRPRGRGLDPAERRRVMEAVGLKVAGGWIRQFALLLGLSVVVAVMGVSADSAAVVIGAMLLAPLMGPVLGVGAALAMGLPRSLARALVIVVSASLGSVALAYGLAARLRDGPLPEEVLSRTSPDLRDLVVALAAGAAGSYATVRKDVSSALPGVAVAVALVPPLAAIGVTLEAGRTDLAGGAVLLYLTNLAAIVGVAAVVFIITGFVPIRRLQQERHRVVAASLVVVVALAALAAPLTLASTRAAADGRRREQLMSATQAWLEGSGADIDEVRLGDGVLRVRLSGPTEPPSTAELERAVHDIAGPEIGLEVRWTQTRTPVPDEPSPEHDASEPGDEAVRRVVEEWLSAAGMGPTLEGVEISGGEVTVEMRSADPPPPIEGLVAELDDQLDSTLSVVVNWTQHTTLRGTDSDDSLRRQVETTADTWSRDQGQVTVTAVEVDGRRITIDLSGPDPGPDPEEVATLRQAVHDIAGETAEVDIWHTPRQLLPAPAR